MNEKLQQTINENLFKLNIPFIEDSYNEQIAHHLDELANLYGFTSLKQYVDLRLVEGLTAEIGVLIQYKDLENNNGVYVFCINTDQSISLMSIIPSTIDKSPQILSISGNIQNAITGMDLPILTCFDKVEIAGYVIVNTVIKPLMQALNIRKEQEKDFIMMYLPNFLATVAKQYLGDKSLRQEEVEMIPFQIKKILDIKENDKLDASRENGVSKNAEEKLKEKIEQEGVEENDSQSNQEESQEQSEKA